MEIIIVVLFYFLVFNIFTYFIYAYDKKQAIKNKYRISEKFLLFLVVGGGIFGALLSMIKYRHKIKKIAFILKFIVSSILFIYLLVEFNNNILIFINEFLLSFL